MRQARANIFTFRVHTSLRTLIRTVALNSPPIADAQRCVSKQERDGGGGALHSRARPPSIPLLSSLERVVAAKRDRCCGNKPKTKQNFHAEKSSAS